MSQTNEYFEWCKKIHDGGLTKCPFCCQNISVTVINFRLLHYQQCDVAQKFFEEIFKNK